jgi:hypothetical protein
MALTSNKLHIPGRSYILAQKISVNLTMRTMDMVQGQTLRIKRVTVMVCAWVLSMALGDQFASYTVKSACNPAINQLAVP